MSKTYLCALVVIERLLNGELEITMDDVQENYEPCMEYLCKEAMRMRRTFL